MAALDVTMGGVVIPAPAGAGKRRRGKTQQWAQQGLDLQHRRGADVHCHVQEQQQKRDEPPTTDCQGGHGRRCWHQVVFPSHEIALHQRQQLTLKSHVISESDKKEHKRGVRATRERRGLTSSAQLPSAQPTMRRRVRQSASFEGGTARYQGTHRWIDWRSGKYPNCTRLPNSRRSDTNTSRFPCNPSVWAPLQQGTRSTHSTQHRHSQLPAATDSIRQE